MRIDRIKNAITRFGFYIPVTLYFLIFLTAVYFSWSVLYGANREPDTAVTAVFELLATTAIWFCIAIVTLACTTVLVSWLFFVFQKRKHGVDFKLTTDVAESELHQKQSVRLRISPVLKPLFGFIKLRLLYDDNHYSPKFSLLEKSRRTFFSTTIEGTYNWPLPQIKEYHVQQAILYIEDVFQFFSIAVNLETNNHFFTQPTSKQVSQLKISPRKTEETTTRIEEIKRVQGEYLNYKNFENNDDVRRIVWKIYARNKELVVRIPEIMDPYASHLYLYVSFFSNFNTDGNGAVEIPFLNYYKVYSWAIYQNLVKQGFEVRFIPDQEVANSNKNDLDQWVKYSLSTSNWQRNNDLKSYAKTNDASLIIVSSLSNVDEVRELADQFGKDIRFIFIKLSDSLHKQSVFDILQLVFIQKEQNDIEVYKREWSFSRVRNSILQNEKALEKVLENYHEQVIM